MCIYRSYIRPLLFKLDPEISHDLAHNVIAKWLPIFAPLTKKFIYARDDLRVSHVFSKTAKNKVDLAIKSFEPFLNNPIGLAAGFDKNGDLVHALKYLGFGYAEIGSITAQAHEGNPKPRLWRLPKDNALINWMGLNGEGAVHISAKLANSQFSLPIGINIAKSNKAEISGERAKEDLLFSFRAIRHLPVLYVAINISCVNTPEGILQETNLLSEFLQCLEAENINRLPILIKLSEDGSDELIENIVSIGKQFSVAGYICGNTSRQRSPLKTSAEIVDKIKNGGLSGPPIKSLVLPLCRKVYELKDANQIIIGNGGITNGKDAYEYIRAGSSLVQIYTALIYEGPSVVKKIGEELSELLRNDRLTLEQAIGIDYIKQKSAL